VLVTGAAGQLAWAVRDIFRDCDVLPMTREALDVTDPKAVAREVAALRPDVIINCAAFNDVDAAQDRPRDAFALNAFAVRSLARAADACGAALVHYGTDFVFDGTADAPYDEAARPAPQSVYAASKLVGEWFALEASRGFVLRVESLFGTPPGWNGRRGSLDRIREGLTEGREVPVFVDRTVSPSFVPDVARATRHLLEAGSVPGVYHCVNSGSATWLEVGEALARAMGVVPRFRGVRMAEATLKANRPVYCALSNRRLAAAGFPMPDWRDALTRWLSTTNVREAKVE
jgi:dTDP-4-dehydrorhamnose reductase